MVHIELFPLFQQTLNASPYFREIYRSSPIFVHFTCFALFTFSVSPYFDHDAFMHHVLHLLDVPARIRSNLLSSLFSVPSPFPKTFADVNYDQEIGIPLPQ